MVPGYPGNRDEKNTRGKQDVAEERRIDDRCRCKETSKMTPREFLKLMASDLAFWKKSKRD